VIGTAPKLGFAAGVTRFDTATGGLGCTVCFDEARGALTPAVAAPVLGNRRGSADTGGALDGLGATRVLCTTATFFQDKKASVRTTARLKTIGPMRPNAECLIEQTSRYLSTHRFTSFEVSLERRPRICRADLQAK